MALLFLLARIVFAWFWIYSGYNHFKNLSNMAGYAASKGIPSPKAAVAGTGILLIFGGLSMLTGIWTTAGIIALAIFLLGTTFTMHAYWKDQDPMAKMSNAVNFRKNIALLAALVMMLMIATPWIYSL